MGDYICFELIIAHTFEIKWIFTGHTFCIFAGSPPGPSGFSNMAVFTVAGLQIKFALSIIHSDDYIFSINATQYLIRSYSYHF